MTLRAAIIGAGQIGRHHARIYRTLETVELVAVADTDQATVNSITRNSLTRGYTDYSRLFDEENVDLVSVCTPTKSHCQIACEAMMQGAHVVVEKPLATSSDEGHVMEQCAISNNVILTVGHVERFNPAIMEVKRRLDVAELGRIYQMHARRLSPFPIRIQDVGVILDLASHDVDVMRYLTGTDVERVYAETANRVHRQHEDMLSGLLRFANGTIGVLDINWLMPAKIRQLTIIGENGAYVVDYLTQDLYWYKNGNMDSLYDAINVVRGPVEGDVIKVQIQRREPLQVELEAFVDAVRNGGPAPVSCADGIATLKLTDSLIQSGLMHQPVYLVN